MGFFFFLFFNNWMIGDSNSDFPMSYVCVYTYFIELLVIYIDIYVCVFLTYNLYVLI